MVNLLQREFLLIWVDPVVTFLFDELSFQQKKKTGIVYSLKGCLQRRLKVKNTKYPTQALKSFNGNKKKTIIDLKTFRRKPNCQVSLIIRGEHQRSPLLDRKTIKKRIKYRVKIFEILDKYVVNRSYTLKMNCGVLCFVVLFASPRPVFRSIVFVHLLKAKSLFRKVPSFLGNFIVVSTFNFITCGCPLNTLKMSPSCNVYLKRKETGIRRH